MRVTIWDMDYYYKRKFMPNHTAQKVSSYHKQKGHTINFVENEYHLGFAYDLMYIFRDKRDTPMPNRQYIDNDNVRLIGEEFKFYNNYYEVPLVIDAVRPDYSLYEFDDIVSKSHVVQLMSGRTVLPKIQDPTRFHEKGIQYHYIIDKFLWQDENTALEIISKLNTYKNVAFKYPVSLRTILSNPEVEAKFINIDFSSHFTLRFRNDYGHTVEHAQQIVRFIVRLRTQRSKKLYVAPIPFKPILLDHWEDKKFGKKDFKRVLRIVDYAKAHKVRVMMVLPPERVTTPYWHYFEMLDTWTQEHLEMSYIESMLATRTNRKKTEWHKILNNSLYWSSPRAVLLAHLLIDETEFMREYATRRWGEEKIDFSKINLTEVSKIKYYYERGE